MASAAMRETARPAPLAGVRVVEYRTGFAGAFTGLTLADLGADVVRIDMPHAVEPDEPLAGAAAEDAVAEAMQHLALDRNKRTVALDPDAARDRATLRELLSRADVLITQCADEALAALDLPALPQLVHCALAPVADDLLVQAASGCMDLTGAPGDPPTRTGVPLAGLTAGMYGAIAALGGLRRRAADSMGSAIAVDAGDALIAFMNYVVTVYVNTGRSARKVGAGHPTIYPYNAFRTRDNHIVVACFTQDFWRKYCRAIGQAGLIEDPRFKSFSARLANKAALMEILDPVMRTRTTLEWEAILTEGDVPVGPVYGVAAALTAPQTLARRMVTEANGPAGSYPCVHTPFNFDGAKPVAARAAFMPGQDGAAVLAQWLDGAHAGTAGRVSAKPAVAHQDPASRLPLSGVRVLDFTRMVAGTTGAMVLADLGAEVIKLEAPRIGDPTRANIPRIPAGSPTFLTCNRGKKSLVLDLKLPEAQAVARELAAQCDVIIENFRPGVMEELGLGFEALRERNPDLVFCSLSGFGVSGPMRERKSFDLVNQAFAGLISITGHPGSQPARLGPPVGDVTGGLYAVIAILAALNTAARPRGTHIELALHDCLLSLLGPVGQESLLDGTQFGPGGSHDHWVAPNACYESADGWIAVVAAAPAAWMRLTALPEFAALRAEPRFATPASRRAHVAALDAALAPVFRTRPAAAWLAVLARQGIACTAVRTVAEALDAPHTLARGMVLDMTHPQGGPFKVPNSPLRTGAGRWVSDRPAPQLGEHTDSILGELLGASGETIAAWRAAGVVA